MHGLGAIPVIQTTAGNKRPFRKNEDFHRGGEGWGRGFEPLTEEK